MPDLSPAGWPRPIVNGYPVPWVSLPRDLGQTDPDRHRQVVEQGLCQVCGWTHEGGDWAYLLANGDPPHDEGGEGLIVLAMDDAVMHERCFRLAVGRCPGLARVGELRAFRVRAMAVDAYEHDGEDRLGAPLADCEPMGLP